LADVANENPGTETLYFFRIDLAASSVMILWSVFIVSAKIFVIEFIVDRSKSLLLY